MSAPRDELAARRAAKAAEASKAERRYERDLEAAIKRHPAGRARGTNR